MLLLEQHNNNTLDAGDLDKMDKTKPNDTNTESKDEVDYSPTKVSAIFPLTTTKKGTFGDVESSKPQSTSHFKCSLNKLEKLNLFQQLSPLRNKKHITTQDTSPTTTTTTTTSQAVKSPKLTSKEKPKFTKGTSIARIFGNTYSTKKCNSIISGSGGGSAPTTPITTPKHFDRFRKTHSDKNTESNDEMHMSDFNESPERDISTKAMRTLSKGLGRLLRRRSSSVDISEPDPEFKVAYLGNVLTGWAKGM